MIYVLIPKKDEILHVCVDSRPPNKIVIKHHFSISRLGDMLAMMLGATVFSKKTPKSGHF